MQFLKRERSSSCPFRSVIHQEHNHFGNLKYTNSGKLGEESVLTFSMVLRFSLGTFHGHHSEMGYHATLGFDLRQYYVSTA